MRDKDKPDGQTRKCPSGMSLHFKDKPEKCPCVPRVSIRTRTNPRNVPKKTYNRAVFEP